MLISLEFDQLYCVNELLANDVLMVSKILLGYEEALWPKKLEISHQRGSNFGSFLVILLLL